MTTININKVTSYTSSFNNITEVDFTFLGKKVYAAQQTESIYAAYYSPIIQTQDSIIKYNQAIWSETKDSNSEIWLYAKSANTNNGLSLTNWIGPFNNGKADLTSLTGEFIQFCFVMKGIDGHWPSISAINIEYFIAKDAVKFFTKTFDIGFSPKNVVLTYNATTDSDTIIRFALTGLDTTDNSYYQYIQPNKIVSLTEWPFASNKLKVMLEFIGSTQINAAVNEFALIFAGDDGRNQERLNKIV